MDGDVKVSLDMLRKAVSIALDRLKEDKGEELELRLDYFWEILDVDSRYDETIMPGELSLSLGSLEDSLEYVQDLTRNPDSALTVHLRWIADIFRAIDAQVK